MIPTFTVSLAQTWSEKEIAVAATGMAIVFAALLLITLFISALPRILRLVANVLPEVPGRHAPVDASESLLPDEAILAAIGYVLHTEIQRPVGADEGASR